MAEDREMNHYYNQFEEEDVPRSQPGPIVEEEEEEEFTIDFKNMLAYDKGSAVEGVIAMPTKPAAIPVEGSILPTEEMKIEYIEKEKPRTFKDDLLDRIVDGLASKAIRHLVIKENKRIDAVYSTLSENSVSQSSGLSEDALAEAVLKPLEDRKEELRKSRNFAGDVDYTKIPDWAKQDVIDYINNAITGLCILTEDDK